MFFFTYFSIIDVGSMISKTQSTGYEKKNAMEIEIKSYFIFYIAFLMLINDNQQWINKGEKTEKQARYCLTFVLTKHAVMKERILGLTQILI